MKTIFATFSITILAVIIALFIFLSMRRASPQEFLNVTYNNYIRELNYRGIDVRADIRDCEIRTELTPDYHDDGAYAVGWCSYPISDKKKLSHSVAMDQMARRVYSDTAITDNKYNDVANDWQDN